MNNNTIITISSGTIMKAILIVLLFALLYILRDLVLVLLTAVVIASSIEPATKWLGKYKIPRVPAVLFIYLFVVGIFASLLYFFIPPVLNEASSLMSSVPQYVESIELYNPVDTFGITGVDGFVGGISESISLSDVITNLQSVAANLSGSTFQTISLIFGGLFSFILIVIISFYFSVQENGIESFLQIISPVKHEKYVVGLWKRSQAKIGKWMQGQLLLGALIGILVYLGLTVLGVKYAIILALLAAIAELIPVFGPILAAVPAVALGFIDSVTLGLMVAGFYVIIQQFENHLIYPLVVRKVVGVPPLLVILSLIIGAKLAGFLGIILSVPIAAAIVEFTDDIQKEKKKLVHEK